MLDLLTEQVVGYYDPETKVLYVVEEAPLEQASIIIAHELVHALQDQYMSLDSLQLLRGDNDRQIAAHAVVEGQATIVQIQSMLGGADIATALPGGWDRVRDMIRESSSQMPVFATAPRIIQETLIFPYLSGAEFMRTFQQLRPGEVRTGTCRASTEQIIHSRAYQRAGCPHGVTLLSPRIGRNRYQNNLGEFETRIFLYEHVKEQSAAVRGAAGWDGDRYTVIDTPRGDAFGWVTVWDSPVEAAGVHRGPRPRDRAAVRRRAHARGGRREALRGERPRGLVVGAGMSLVAAVYLHRRALGRGVAPASFSSSPGQEPGVRIGGVREGLRRERVHSPEASPDTPAPTPTTSS